MAVQVSPKQETPSLPSPPVRSERLVGASKLALLLPEKPVVPVVVTNDTTTWGKQAAGRAKAFRVVGVGKQSRSASREHHHRGLFERVRTCLCYTVHSRAVDRGHPRWPPAFCCAGLSLVSLPAAPEEVPLPSLYKYELGWVPPPLLIHLSVRSFFFPFSFFSPLPPSSRYGGWPGSLAPRGGRRQPEVFFAHRHPSSDVTSTHCARRIRRRMEQSYTYGT